MALKRLPAALCALMLILPAYRSELVSTAQPFPASQHPQTSPARVQQELGQPSFTAGSQAQPTPAPPESIVGFFGFPEGVNPLTGLPVAEPALLQRRPVLVKVSNYPPSVRPQAGLSFADIVFEYYIGEGANRFLALYYGQDASKVGSLRSGRLVDGPLTRLFQGLLVYGGADPRVDAVLQRELGDRAISHLEAACPSICGDDTHASPWVYANTAEITEYATRKGINNDPPVLYGLLFDPAPPQSDQFAVQVGVEYASFNRGEWRYDSVSGTYLRWVEHNLSKQEMVPLTDRINNKHLTFQNVILLFTTYIQYNETLHDIQIWDNNYGQPAVFFRDGLMITGSWRVAGRDQPIQFYNQWGLPMALKPGNTWIVIVGLSSTLSQPAAGTWELHFSQP